MSQFQPPPSGDRWAGWSQPEPQQSGQQSFPQWQSPQQPSYPPQQATGYPQWQGQPQQQAFPQQQNTGYYPQWQQTFLPPQPPPQTPIPPQLLPKKPMSPRKRGRRRLFIVWATIFTLLIIVIAAFAAQVASSNSSSSASDQLTATAQQNTAATATANSSDLTRVADNQTATASQPTPTVVPTESLAQQESDFKAGCQNYTVVNLDKGGSTLTGTNVHFEAQIISFAKDTNGNVSAANVTDPSDSSFVFIQVEFASGTDITQINARDTIEVWGTDLGSFSGTNAYGATVQEVAVQIFYMTDLTTGYSYNPGS